jgi:restriction system protein
MATKPPTFDRLMNPLLRALRSLGGSGSVEEIYDKVVELEKLPDDVLSQLHDPEKSNQTEVAYRLAWARTYLKKYGLLENSTRGIWARRRRRKRNRSTRKTLPRRCGHSTRRKHPRRKPRLPSRPRPLKKRSGSRDYTPS